MTHHEHSDHSTGDAHDAHGAMGHVIPWQLLVGVLLALLVLTGATVYFASLGLGSRTSFMIAMAIGTIKAGLVVTFFMHLLWDRRFHLVAFLGCFLFVSLFIGMALTDKSEYTPDIKKADEAALQAK